MCNGSSEAVYTALGDYNFTKINENDTREIRCWQSNITCDRDICTCDYKGNSYGLNVGGNTFFIWQSCPYPLALVVSVPPPLPLPTNQIQLVIIIYLVILSFACMQPLFSLLRFD